MDAVTVENPTPWYELKVCQYPEHKYEIILLGFFTEKKTKFCHRYLGLDSLEERTRPSNLTHSKLVG